MKKNDELRERILELILEQVQIDEDILVEEFHVSARTIARARAEVNKSLPQEQREKRPASEKQIATLLKFMSELGPVHDIEGLKAGLRALSSKQACGLMKMMFKLNGVKKMMSSSFAQNVAKKPLSHVQVNLF